MIMSETNDLASRIRSRIALDPRITEKKMFGGIAFLLNGNMFLGVTGKAALMVRIGKDNDDLARALPSAENVDFDATRRGGLLIVEADAVAEELHLDGWVRLAHAFAATLPPK
jgi:TfoX/Sxy family transcriptional regulator of competence genes